MIEKVANRIIRATCSKTLQDAIKKSKFEFTDFDLLYLAYNRAADYKTKLELLQLIGKNTNDDKVKAQATRCIEYKKANLERVLSLEDDCIFEVKIKDKPDSYEERYIAKTFESIFKTIQNFCGHYEVLFTEQTRFTITKRKFTDDMTAETFDEDWRGEVNYKGNFIMLDASHDELRDQRAGLADANCDDECDECKLRPCIFNYAPKLPPFLENMTLVCYSDCDGATKYGVYFGDMETDPNDDCAYLVALPDNAFSEKTFKTKEQFFDLIFGLHTHIEFPRLDIPKMTHIPDEIRTEYKQFKKLYTRFNKEIK